MSSKLVTKNGFTYTIPANLSEYSTYAHEFHPFPIDKKSTVGITCGPFEFIYEPYSECMNTPPVFIESLKYQGKTYLIADRGYQIAGIVNYYFLNTTVESFLGKTIRQLRKLTEPNLFATSYEFVHESRAIELNHHLQVLRKLWIQEKSQETRRIKKEEAEKQGLSLKEFYVAAKEKKRLTKDLNRTKQWLIFGPQVLTAIEDLEAFKRSISESKDFDRKAFNRMRREIIALMTDLSKMQYLDKI